MYRRLFEEFLAGGDSLRVYQGDKLVFASEEDGLLPLLEYIEKYAAGYRQVVWDGTNADGRKVASGVYMYRMEADDFVSKKRMVLLK